MQVAPNGGRQIWKVEGRCMQVAPNGGRQIWKVEPDRSLRASTWWCPRRRLAHLPYLDLEERLPYLDQEARDQVARAAKALRWTL